jgi:succinate dehydrogenase/fumarate reductase flavoprotein subunit
MNVTETSEQAPTIAEELQRTIVDLMHGKRYPEKMQSACERMDRLREENCRLLGEQNIAVELVRQTRNQQ